MKTLVVLLVLIDGSFLYQLHCKLEKTGWDDILMGSAFACKTQNLNISSPQTKITKVFPEKSDKVVNAFLVLDQNCEYFPVDVERFFKNIEGIAIQKSNLKKITKKDLKGFANLRSISLYGNKIRVIENELFRYNPKLELVSLFSNQLHHIFTSAFENLVNLKALYLNSNPCINRDALVPARIEDIKCDIVRECKVTEQMSEFAELETEKLKLEEENTKLVVNFDALNKNFAAVNKNVARFKDGYERLKQHIDLNFNSTENCVISNVEIRKCESEKHELLEMIQDMEIVELKCKPFSGVNRCDAYDLKILKPSFKVVSVKGVEKPREIAELIINNQQILFLPLNLTNFFRNLIKFSVTSSQLLEIDHEIFIGLGSLQEINLSSNRITEIRKFNELNELISLDLSYNRIESIENSAFSQLRNLQEIRLNDNLLTRVKGKMFSINHKLRIIHLKNNKISQVASNFVDFLKKVEFLDLTNNNCVDSKYPETSLEDLVSELNQYCDVEIEFECRFELRSSYTCHAENLEIDSRNVKILRVVGAHQNNLTDKDVTDVYIEDQRMEFFPRKIGVAFPQLKVLNVKNSGLQEISDESFEDLKNIQELSITSNNLTEFNTLAFDADFTRLERIDFSQNFIETLPEDVFVNFTSLKYLSFNHNKLTSLENSMFSAVNDIEQVDFSQNSLTYIDPEIIKTLKKIKSIDFSQNSCISSKYDQKFNNIKKLMEIFGEIHFKCV